MSNGWVTRPRAIKAKVVPSPPPAGVSGKEGCPLVSVVGRKWLVQGSESWQRQPLAWGREKGG